MTKRFIGVDGEGGTVNGHHSYYLLRAGEDYIYKQKPLSTYDCLEFLAGLDVTDKIYVSFFFDYDVTQIVRGLPLYVLNQFFDRESRQHRRNGSVIGHGHAKPVSFWGFEFDYMPHKWFKVRKKGTKSWVTINDVSGFFQSSFLKALQLWKVGSPEVLAKIDEGKRSRAQLTGDYTAEDIRYNELECELLAELMEKVRYTMNQVGYVPVQWQGAGSLASAILKKHDVPKYIELDPELASKAQNAYYGGRFELSYVGEYEGKVHEYDLASAYPAAMLELPCLMHGKWKKTTDPKGLYLAHVEYKTHNEMWGAFPYRDKEGHIFYPEQGSGWFWSYEIEVAKSHPELWEVKVTDAMEFSTTCKCKPFEFVKDIFEQRRALGKSDAGIVLKLGMNSLYGKTAQSVGMAPYANPVWAGLITSITRARLLEVIGKYPDKVVMCATDGIYLLDTTIESDYPIVEDGEDSQLGDWEHQVYNSMFFIQPGLYHSPDDHHPKLRSRGTPASVVENRLEDFKAAWRNDRFNGSIEFFLVNYRGGRLAWHLGRMQEMGQWVYDPKTVTFKSNELKRTLKMFPDKKDKNSLLAKTTIRYGDYGESMPYSKNIGGKLSGIMLSQMYEAPDYAINDLVGSLEVGFPVSDPDINHKLVIGGSND